MTRCTSGLKDESEGKEDKNEVIMRFHQALYLVY